MPSDTNAITALQTRVKALEQSMNDVGKALRQAQQVGLLAGDGTPGTFTKWANTSQVADSSVLTESDSGDLILGGNIIPATDGDFTVGSPDFRWAAVYSEQFSYSDTVGIYWGDGVPTLVADVGSAYFNLLGGPGTTFYVKDAGSGTASGWDAWVPLSGTKDHLAMFDPTGKTVIDTPAVWEHTVFPGTLHLTDSVNLEIDNAAVIYGQYTNGDATELATVASTDHIAFGPRLNPAGVGAGVEVVVRSASDGAARGEFWLDGTKGFFTFNDKPANNVARGHLLLRPIDLTVDGFKFKNVAGYEGAPFVAVDEADVDLFVVEPDGNLEAIRKVKYRWPTSHPAPATEGAMKVLGYTSVDVGTNQAILGWLDPSGGPGGISPGGPVNRLAKFTPDTVSVGPAGVVDDGVNVSLIHPADDWVQLGFATTDTAIPEDHLAIWRYEHRSSGVGYPEGASSPNIASGEMQLFLNSSDACVFFGQGRSYFAMGLVVKPPLGYTSPAFIVVDPDNNPVFEVDPDGNVSCILGQLYLWPSSIPDPAGGTKVLGYSSIAGGYAHLGWVTAGAGTGGGSGTVGPGSINTLAMFTDTEVVGNSNITQLTSTGPPPSTQIRALCNSLISVYPAGSDNDLAQIGWETYTTSGPHNYAVWRYEHRVAGLAGTTLSPNVIGGEMQLFLNTTNPCIWLGTNRTFFGMGLNVNLPSGYTDSAFDVRDPSAALTFQLLSNGNLAVVRGIPYEWPVAPLSYPVSGAMKVLGYTTASGVPTLQWLDPLPPAGVILGSGTIGKLPRFTAVRTLGDSGVRDDLTTVYIERGFAINSFHSPTYPTSPGPDLSEAAWQTDGGVSAIWRYDHRIGVFGALGDPANTTGEMQLFLNSSNPCLYLGAATMTAISNQFRIKHPSLDLAEIGLATTSTAYGIWRYEHRVAGMVGGPTTSLNIASGEMQAFLNGSLGGQPAFQIGAAVSYFATDLMVQGNLARINTVNYIWPNTTPTVGAFLQYSNATTGQLTWTIPTGGGNVSVSNAGGPNQPQCWIPRWNGAGNLLETSAIQDRTGLNPLASGYGTVEIDCLQLLFKRIDSTDISDFYMRTGLSNTTLIRYDHRAIGGGGFGGAGIQDPANANELQFWLLAGGGFTTLATAVIGDVHSWFESGMRIRPTAANAGTVGNLLELRTISPDALAFTVDQNGNLTTLNRVNYSWPNPLGFTTGSRWLQCDASGNLTWQPPPSGGGNVSTSATGTTGTLPIFTGASTIGNSVITDNGTVIGMAQRDFIVTGRPGFDVAEIGLSVDATYYGFLRYTKANFPTNTLGEMGLFIGTGVSPQHYFGTNFSFIGSGTLMRAGPTSTFILEGQNSGTTPKFRVDLNGALSLINGQSYASWPSNHGPGVLTADASGNLTWVAGTVNWLPKFGPTAGQLTDSGISDAGSGNVIGVGGAAPHNRTAIYPNNAMSLGDPSSAFTACYATTGQFQFLQGFSSPAYISVLDDLVMASGSKIQISEKLTFTADPNNTGLVWTGTTPPTVPAVHQFSCYVSGLQVAAFTDGSDAVFIRVGGALQAIHVASGTTVPGGGRALYI